MRARTWIATTAVSALAATTALVGVAAVGPANAAVTTQPAGVSITVDSTGSNTAFVTSAVVANLTVRDNAASATIGAFTAVVPAGVVGPVKVVGVDHGWGYTTLPCAGTANCSAIVLAYASLPLSSSILRPGQAVTIAFSFRTGRKSSWSIGRHTDLSPAQVPRHRQRPVHRDEHADHQRHQRRGRVLLRVTDRGTAHGR